MQTTNPNHRPVMPGKDHHRRATATEHKKLQPAAIPGESLLAHQGFVENQASDQHHPPSTFKN